MNIKIGEKKQGTGTSEKMIGYFQGSLISVNPSLEELKTIHGWADKDEEKEPSYTGTDRNGKDWARLLFVFQEELTKKPIEYTVFMNKELSGPIKCKDGVERTFWVNQFGDSQMVDKEENLFSSFTHLQAYNKESGKYENVLGENGEPIKLVYREAYGGEVELYDLLHNLVTQDWFTADQETSLFIKIDLLMRGAVKDISMYIGTETFQPVVGMMYVEAKDTDNGVQYTNNCVDQAWMPGWKIKDVNITTSSNSWNKFEVAPKGKGSYKLKDMYNFYQSCKRNKHMWALAPLAVFSAENYQAAGSVAFIPAEGGTTVPPTDMLY